MTAPTDTTFISGTKITSEWLNGVNDHVNNLEADPHPSYLSKTEAASTYTTQADLASSAVGKGAELVEYQSATVEAALNERLPEVGNYAALDAYTGDATAVMVYGVQNIFDGGAGVFRRTTDTPAAANGIYRQDALGRWWKRDFVGAVNVLWFGAKADSGLTDNYLPFRSAVVAGFPVEVHEGPGYYGTSKGIVTTSDTYVHLTGIGMPEIKLTGALSTTDMNANCMARMSSSATTWAICNFLFTGNWDGVAAHPGQPGAGILTAPAENCITFIDNVECNDFSDYGISFYTIRATAGKIRAHRNRYQGVAVTNVRDGLIIDEIVASDNGMFGLDIEWSKGSSPMRTIGLRNIRIGTVHADGNGFGGSAISSGGGTNADLVARGLVADDFDVFIGALYLGNNGADSAFEAGALIDIPNCEIGSIVSKGDSTSVLIRTTQDIAKNKVIIGSIKAMYSVINGVYITGRAGYEYNTLRIGSIDSKNNAYRGIYIDSVGLAKSLTIGEIINDSGNGIASTVQNSVRVLRGLWQGANFSIPNTRPIKIDVPALTAGQSVAVQIPSDVYWQDVTVFVRAADATNPRLRVRINSTKADIRGGTTGVRTIGLTANSLNAVDTNTAPIGLDAYGYTLTLQAIEAITAGTFTVLATQVLP